MVVDYLSTFYTMPCLLTIGGQLVQTTIRWYRAPAGAKPLPFPTTFFSHINDADPGESIPGEMGEVGFPRTWDPGRNPGYQGQCYRGDPAWFASGQLPALNTLAPSACPCQIPAAIAEGGLVLGGSGVVEVPGRNCQSYRAGTPTLDFGRGPVAMTSVGSGRWVLTLDNWASEGWILRVGGTAKCADLNFRVGVNRSSGPPFAADDTTLVLVQVDSVFRNGRWYEPTTSPFSPGQTVVVSTGPV